MKQMVDQVISIICPLSSTSDFIKAQIENICSVCEKNYDQYEIILINDGMNELDSAVLSQIIQNQAQGLRLIRLVKSVGFAIAVRAGLDSCIGDYVLVIDLSTDPTSCIIPILKQSVISGRVVLGVRNDSKEDSLLIRCGRAVFYYICDHYLGLSFQKNTTFLAAIPRQVVNFVIRNQDRFGFIKLITAQVGVATDGYPYNFIAGHKKVGRSFFKSVDLSIKVVTGETQTPLRVVALGALALSALNLLYVVYVFLIYFFKNTVAEGWTTLSLQISVGLFLLFLTLAIISEYLSVLLAQLRPSALYHVLGEQNSGSLIANGNRLNVINQSTEQKEK